jgi:hypothetical protein
LISPKVGQTLHWPIDLKTNDKIKYLIEKSISVSEQKRTKFEQVQAK